MLRILRALLVGALVLAVAMVGATPAGAKRAGADRPFKASGDGHTVNAEIPGGCDFTNPDLVCSQEIFMDFIGTHIGKGTYTGTGQFTIHTDQSCTAANGNPGVEVDVFQKGEIVAANGDELWFESSFGGCNDAPGSVFEPVGVYTITGGTGRFVDATGTGTVEVISYDGTNVSHRWSGLITY